MRPIDADALKTDLTRFYDNEVTAKQLIDEQPTIQPDAPRVMKMADIWEAGEDKPLFIEYKLPNETKLKPAIFQPENSDDEYMCVVSAWCGSGFYSSKSYNMDWRCWTARPTDEQREAAKWDG